MSQLQTVLDALTNDGTHEEGCPDSNDCFNTDCDYCSPIRAMRELNAIAIVKQMMQDEPVAWRTDHPMLFDDYDEATTYCDDPETEIEPLYTKPKEPT
jgi:hypothetical protein